MLVHAMGLESAWFRNLPPSGDGNHRHSQACRKICGHFSPPPSPNQPAAAGFFLNYGIAKSAAKPIDLVTQLAGAFDCFDSRANAAASAGSTLPAVFAIRPRKVGEHYNVRSRACEFSRGPIGNKFGLSNSPPTSPGLGHPVRGRNLNAGKDVRARIIFIVR